MPNNLARKIFNISVIDSNLKAYIRDVTISDLIKYDEDFLNNGFGVKNIVITGESSSVGNALTVNNFLNTLKLGVANSGRITIGRDDSVTAINVAVVTPSTTNTSICINPNGNGAFQLSPNGNSRGQNAVDLQVRIPTSNNRVASGAYSFAQGEDCTASQPNSIAMGNFATSSGQYAVALGGYGANASAISSYAFGDWSNAWLRGQRSQSSGSFGTNQRNVLTTDIRMFKEIGGINPQTLLINQTDTANLLNGSSWRCLVDVNAYVTAAGTGALVVGDCFMGTYNVGIKRGANAASTTLVGSVNTLNVVSDTNMSTSVVTIDADTTNGALRIQFTPPSTASATSTIRVVATVYITHYGG